MQAALYQVTCKSLRLSMQQSSRRRSISAALAHLQQRDYQVAQQAMRCFSQKTGAGSNAGAAEQHEEFFKQMQELQAERDTLFGFTDHDRNGWTNVSKDHQFDRSFLDEINQARRDDDHDSSADATTQSDTTSSESSSDIEVTTTQPETKQNNNVVGFAGLSHLSTDGTSVRMVNVGDKLVTTRVAVAQSTVLLPDAVIKAFRRQPDNAAYGNDLVGPKGPIFATAKVAGIMAAKKTSELIPLCHPLPLDSVNIDITLNSTTGTVTIQCECRVTHKTGVEMEALTGATVAALTIYDMVKAVSHDIEISQTRLLSKSGGKRTFQHPEVDGKK